MYGRTRILLLFGSGVSNESRIFAAFVHRTLDLVLRRVRFL